MGVFADLLGTLRTTFRIGPKAAPGTISAALLTAARTASLPDKSGTLATTVQTDETITAWFRQVSDGTVKLLANAPHGGTITEITTVSEAGTATVTGKINTTSLGGTANDISTTEQTRTHATANVFAPGDDFVLAFTGNSGCLRATVTVKYTRTIG